MIKHLCKEDEIEISKLYKCINSNINNACSLILLKPDYIPRVGRNSLRWKLNDGEKYYFETEGSVMEGLSQFLSDDYTQRVLAKNSYIYDEGEEFEEVFPCDKVLGYAKNSHNRYEKTNLLKIVFTPMAWGERDSTGLPFHVERLNLVCNE